jgi:UDP-glucose 4-epimerase
MSILITGAAGFIGANLVARCLSQGNNVLAIDNLSRGKRDNLRACQVNPRLTFAQLDLSNLSAFESCVAKYHTKDPIQAVWHLAANSDIPAGIADAGVDLRDTFLTTFNTLEVMKQLSIPSLAFASSSAVYGDFGNQVLTEDTGPLFPISNYGAMKLASEALISAAVEDYLPKAFIFRFPNVIGLPATHGVILDFIHKLQSNAQTLAVLGDGTQQKSYLHVDELINAMFFITEHAKDPLNYFNIGADDNGITVKEIAELVVKRVSSSAKIAYGQGNKGWVGDVPEFSYSIEKLRSLGWQPKLHSHQAVQKAVDQIATAILGA